MWNPLPFIIAVPVTITGYFFGGSDGALIALAGWFTIIAIITGIFIWRRF